MRTTPKPVTGRFSKSKPLSICPRTSISVSYTHLDVYKRQFYLGSDDGLYTFNTTTGECLPTDDGQNKESIYACYQDRDCLLYTSRCV